MKTGHTILTFSDSTEPTLVEQSLSTFGAQCVTLGRGVSQWRNEYKIDLALEWLSQNRCDDVLVCDGFDVLFLDHPRTAFERFRAMDCPMVLNADKRLWPRCQPSDAVFGDFYQNRSDSPFRYLNSGAYIGEREFVIKFLRRAKESTAHAKYQADDQTHFHHAFRDMSGSGATLDYRCDIFQVFNIVRDTDVRRSGDREITNMHFDSHPMILHANKLGRTNVFSEMRDAVLSPSSQDGSPTGGRMSSDEWWESLLDTEARVTVDEARLLDRLAAERQNGVIVEIGSYKGGSTVVLAKADRRNRVYAIDPHTGIKPNPISSWQSFSENLKKHDVSEQVVPIVKTSLEAVEDWSQPVGLLWIDGSHRYRHVKADFMAWDRFVVPGGVIAIHDTRPSTGIVPSMGKAHTGFRGPALVAENLLADSSRFEPIKTVDSISYARKIG